MQEKIQVDALSLQARPLEKEILINTYEICLGILMLATLPHVSLSTFVVHILHKKWS